MPAQHSCAGCAASLQTLLCNHGALGAGKLGSEQKRGVWAGAKSVGGQGACEHACSVRRAAKDTCQSMRPMPRGAQAAPRIHAPHASQQLREPRLPTWHPEAPPAWPAPEHALARPHNPASQRARDRHAPPIRACGRRPARRRPSPRAAAPGFPARTRARASGWRRAWP